MKRKHPEINSGVTGRLESYVASESSTVLPEAVALI